MIGDSFQGRLRLVAFLWWLPLVLVLLMMAWLQLVRGPALLARAESQHILRQRIPPHRGPILDRNGRELATSMFNYSIEADLAEVKDPRGTARALAAALETAPGPLEKKLQGSKGTVSLWTRFTPVLDRRVDLQELPGIREKLELKRIYPLGASAAHVVGCVDREGHGLGGVEYAFESVLKGHPGWTTELRDANGDRHRALGRRSRSAESGQTLELTIDASLQDIAASALDRAVLRTSAKGGALVALDPKTGQILALASSPSFDPGSVLGEKKQNLDNRVLGFPIEPGSTFKLVPAAAALTDGLLQPGSLIHCENGRHDFGGFVVTDHHPYGTLTFEECFAKSSNIAFAKVGRRCGARLHEVAVAFGFGSRTGISLPGESPGRLSPPARWSGRSSATIAYGYEVLVTPLQLAIAFAAVANDGVLLEPQIIKSIVSPDGETTYLGSPRPLRRAIPSEVARTLREFMRKVVEDGTGGEAGLEWVTVGGKTGTAEKFAAGGYGHSRHYASFVGMAPHDDPKIVCFVMIDEPSGTTFGGSAAAPVFRETIESASRLPGAWLSPVYATVVLPDPGERPSLDRIVPSAEAVPSNANPGTLDSEQGLPDVRGESIRRALQVLRAYGVPTRLVGSGAVVSQTPEPGSPADTVVVLTGDHEGIEASLTSGGVAKASETEAVTGGTERR